MSLHLRSISRVMELDNVTKDLEELHWRLQGEKTVTMRKRGRETQNNLLMDSRESVGVGVFMVLLLQNDEICWNRDIGYKHYRENRFKVELLVACYDKLCGSSCTYWCCQRCLPLGLPTEQESYLASLCIAR